MSISERYRGIVSDVREMEKTLKGAQETSEHRALRMVGKALEGLTEFEEQVGEIPRMKLENQLTPVLLKVHSGLDRARLALEEDGFEDLAAAVWDLEQQIYRLLNDL